MLTTDDYRDIIESITNLSSLLVSLGMLPCLDEGLILVLLCLVFLKCCDTFIHISVCLSLSLCVCR